MVNDPIGRSGMLGSPSGRIMKNEKGKIELPPLALIGEEIGKARKKRRMTTLRVSQITRIPERYICCIEAGDFASLPAKPFIFGFTRTICGLLELDADAYIPVIRAELSKLHASEPSVPSQARNPGAVLRRLATLKPSRLS